MNVTAKGNNANNNNKVTKSVHMYCNLQKFQY